MKFIIIIIMVKAELYAKRNHILRKRPLKIFIVIAMCILWIFFPGSLREDVNIEWMKKIIIL